MKFLIIAFIALFTVAISFAGCGNDDEPVATRNTLTYNTNGATSGTTPATITQETGTNVTLNNGTGFSRDGYTFAGWNTSANGTGTNYAGGSSYTLTSNVTLYANWTAVSTAQYTLTYNTNGATSGSAPAAVTQQGGTSIVLNNGTGFSRNGHTFAGWNTSTDGTGTNYAGGSSYTLNSDVTLFARWNAASTSNKLKITIGSTVYTATLNDNATATAFKAMLPLTLNMTEHGRIEKFASLPSTPPANHTNPGTIQNGDIMLYSSNTLVLFYTTHNTSYSYTRIGRVDNPSGLAAALGTGSVTVTFELD
ncbi:MAG: cyclophilin-like fold protein [Petrimonas sp.]|nr:cyclophilin-like fold protein [Petrimonas sp.]